MTGQITELVVGFLLPLVINLVTTRKMSDGVKTSISLVVCVIAGVGTTYVTTGTLGNPQDLTGSILTVTLAAQSFYRNIYKPMLDKAAMKKEPATGGIP